MIKENDKCKSLYLNVREEIQAPSPMLKIAICKIRKGKRKTRQLRLIDDLVSLKYKKINMRDRKDAL